MWGSMSLGMWFDRALQDIRYATRMLFKTPGFTLVAVLTLALGIGANTAVFSVLNAVLLRPLQFHEPDRLVVLFQKMPNFEHGSISYFNLVDWKRMNQSFEAIAGYRNTGYSLTGLGEAEQVKAQMVGHEFLPILQVQPVLGRNFTAEEDAPHGPKVAMISETFWKEKFGGLSDALGKTIRLDGDSYQIIGVVPDSLRLPIQNFGTALQVYTAVGAYDDPGFQSRVHHWGLDAIGRLKPGVSLEQARADMTRVSSDLEAAYPEDNKNLGTSMVGLREGIVGRVRPVLLLLLGSVGFVLLIACANVANLMLARATSRAREFAIRAALGATHGRVIRQLLTESVLLSFTGGMLGLALAVLGTKAAIRLMPTAIPRAENIGVDLPVLLFTAAASLLAGILFGLVPALKMSRPDLNDALKESARGTTGTHHRTQNALVVAETAMALILLVGAGLMIRTLVNLWQEDTGFDANNVLLFTLALPPEQFKSPAEAIRNEYRDIEERLKAIPGVEAVSYSARATPFQNDDEDQFWIEGQPKPASQWEMNWTIDYSVGPGYLKAMGLRLKAGRFIEDQDTTSSPRIAVIDEEFAKKYFPGQDPVGKVIHCENSVGATKIQLDYSIVGVVEHVNQWGLDPRSSLPLRAEMFYPVSQLPDKSAQDLAQNVRVFIRTSGDPASQSGTIRQTLAAYNPNIVMAEPQTMAGVVSRSLASMRFSIILLGTFAAIALMLAMIGIYGVMSYAVGQRTHEIGIRMALGAKPSDLLAMVLKQGAGIALIGIVIGVIVAAMLTRAMHSLLVGVSTGDPLTFAGVAFTLLLMAAIACLVPARRATRVHPLEVLRYQ
jgi:predicted permease